MVTTQSHAITYSHPFAAVTSSLWHKYDHHKYVKDIEILDRHVDEEGRLHSTRLLSMGGNLPTIFLPFVPVKLVHMLETVIVDPQRQTMIVETSNINCQSVLTAYSRSRYTPAPDAPESSTRYEIDIAVRAFPNDAAAAVADRPAATGGFTSPDTVGVTLAAESPPAERGSSKRDAEAAPVTSDHCDSGRAEWTMGIVAGGAPAGSIFTRLQEGYIAGKMESWVANKLLSNVSKGQSYIDGFCRRWHDRHTIVCESSAAANSVQDHDVVAARGGLQGPEGASTGAKVGAAASILLHGRVLGWAGKHLHGAASGAREEEGVRDVASRQLRVSRLLSRQLAHWRVAKPCEDAS